jgi:hypothetical protein
MAKSNTFALASETKLKLVATHKKTFTTFEKEITYSEWINFKKNKDYYYLTYQI